jgi:hypothetical protein
LLGERFMRLAAAALLSLSACSYLMVPRVKPEAPFPCERSKVFAHIDQTYYVLTAASAILYGLVWLMPADSDVEGDLAQEMAAGMVIPNALMAIGFRASARHGYREVAKCHAAHARLPPGMH